MTLSVEQFNKLVTKDEFYFLKDDFSEFKGEFKEFKEEVNEKIDIIIGMLEKGAKDEKEHELEHVANIAAHDRFQREIDQLKTQVKTTTNI